MIVKKKSAKVFVRSSVKLKPHVHKKLKKLCIERSVGIQEFLGAVVETLVMDGEEMRCGKKE